MPQAAAPAPMLLEIGAAPVADSIDGVPPPLLQQQDASEAAAVPAPALAAPQLERGLAEELAQSGLARRSAEGALADLRHDRLWMENVQLRLEAARLRDEAAGLRRQDAELRAQDAALRAEDTLLRKAALAASRVTARGAAGARGIGAQLRQRPAGICLAVVATISFGFGVLWWCDCFQLDDEDDSDVDLDQEEAAHLRRHGQSAEKRLMSLVRRPKDEGRTCWCCGCCICCNNQVMIFFGGVLVITALGGAVLWQMGLLQPVIAEFTVYTYIAVVLVCFLTLLLAQLWRVLRTLVKYVVVEGKRMKGYFKGGFSQARDVMKDFLDDGRLNRSVHHHDHRGTSLRAGLFGAGTGRPGTAPQPPRPH